MTRAARIGAGEAGSGRGAAGPGARAEEAGGAGASSGLREPRRQAGRPGRLLWAPAGELRGDDKEARGRSRARAAWRRVRGGGAVPADGGGGAARRRRDRREGRRRSGDPTGAGAGARLGPAREAAGRAVGPGGPAMGP